MRSICIGISGPDEAVSRILDFLHNEAAKDGATFQEIRSEPPKPSDDAAAPATDLFDGVPADTMPADPFGAILQKRIDAFVGSFRESERARYWVQFAAGAIAKGDPMYGTKADGALEEFDRRFPISKPAACSGVCGKCPAAARTTPDTAAAAPTEQTQQPATCWHCGAVICSPTSHCDSCGQSNPKPAEPAATEQQPEPATTNA